MELKDIFTAAGSTNPTMSRTFRRKKKSVHNSVEQKNSDSTMDKNPFIQSAFVRWERILGRIPHRSNYSSSEYCKRLAGGADKDIVGGNKSVSPAGVEKPTSNGSTTQLAMPQIREPHVSTHDHSRDINENNVDEIIDCAIQNLQEAGKALATLGENHEHELKLMVMDILAKFQKWIDVVQKKMEAARYDVNSIRNALAAQTVVLTAKDRELEELRAKLAECETNNATLQKELAEDQSTIVERHSMSQVVATPEVAASISSGLPSERASRHSPSEATVQPIAPESTLEITAIPLTTAASQHASALTVADDEHASSRTTISFFVPLESGQDVVVEQDKSVNGSPSLDSVARKSIHSQIRNPGSAAAIPSTSQIETNRNQLALDPILIPVQTDSPQPVSEQSHTPAISIEQHPAGSASLNPPVSNAGTMTGDVVVPSAPPPEPNAAPLTSNQDCNQKQDGRVIELEDELMQLRSENERMKKDHAEYENAIQRALLKGVSSLNAEALKVLRNPPFICYKPCVPCNPPQSSLPCDTVENTPCVLRSPRNHVAQRGGKSSSSKVGTICQTRENGMHSSSRKQAASVCYAPAKRSSQNSMLFFLPQQHIDCACTAVVQEYCVGTNYGRAARSFPRERVYCTSRVTAGRDGFRECEVNWFEKSEHSSSFMGLIINVHNLNKHRIFRSADSFGHMRVNRRVTGIVDSSPIKWLTEQESNLGEK